MMKALLPVILLVSLFSNAHAQEPAFKKLVKRIINPFDSKKVENLVKKGSDICAEHFPGQTQIELRSACAQNIDIVVTKDLKLGQTRCRLDFGDDPRLVSACFIGVAVMNEFALHQDTKKEVKVADQNWKKLLIKCQEQYPYHTELDYFLQESCLVGAHLVETFDIRSESELATPALKAHLCRKLTPEKSFIGPCAVGLTLASSTTSTAPAQFNKLCEKYFDHRLLHAGYRACLVSLVFNDTRSMSIDSVIRDCGQIISDSGNDNELAACVVGRELTKVAPTLADANAAKKSLVQSCGDRKVSYQDRDVLMCLTAAAIIDNQENKLISAHCNSIFRTKSKKSKPAQNCIAAAHQLLAQ